MFGVDNSSLRQSENRQVNFLILVEAPTHDSNDSGGKPVERFSTNFTRIQNKTLFRLAL